MADVQEAGGIQDPAPSPRINGAAATLLGPIPLEELFALRTDYQDVPVESLGGHSLRVYALSGTARAKLIPLMADLAADRPDGARVGGAGDSPENIERVMLFKNHVVAASLGYPERDWPLVGGSLGSDAVETLYDVAARLSGLDASSQAEATARLPRKRSTGSPTG